MTDKPKQHLGHWIGPAPTSKEIGVTMVDDHCPVCRNLYAIDSKGEKVCLECGHAPDKKD